MFFFKSLASKRANVSLTCQLDWLGVTQAVKLVPTKGNVSQETDGGPLAFNQGTDSQYLTPAPRAILRRPHSPLSPPPMPVNLEATAEASGPRLALWLTEFSGDEVLSKQRWPVRSGRCHARWKPTPGADAVRVALRVSGSGEVTSFALIATEAPDIDRLSNEIWSAVNRPASRIQETLYPTFQFDLGSVESLSEPVRALMLSAVRSPHAVASELGALGINPDNVDLDSTPPEPKVCEHVPHALTNREYVTSCPWSGDRLCSRDTFLVSEPSGRPFLFVRFESSERVFYQILEPFSGAKRGLFLPDHNFLLSSLRLDRVVQKFRALCVVYSNDLQNYLLDQDRKTAVALNVMSHWGHVFYNELEAFEWLFANEMESFVDVWLESDTAFYRPEEVFPEIDRSKLVQVPGGDALFRYSLEERLLVVRPLYAYHRVEEPTVERLRRYARAKGERTGRSAAIEKRMAGQWPIVWFEIRANDRCWSNQREGIPAAARRLRERYPNLGIVLGGWSRLLSDRGEDEEIFAAERLVVDDILSRLEEVPCEVALGLPLWEKMLFAMNCHASVSVYGSGLIFPWIANIPKLALTGADFRKYALNQVKEGVPNGFEEMLFIPVEFTRDEEATDDERDVTRDFYCDPEKLAEFLDENFLKRLRPA
jgi:hypothetical protein